MRRSTNNRLVLVTGAEGFIGAHLTDALVRSGWSVLAVDRRFTAAPRQEQRVTRHTVDVADREFVRLVRGTRPDVIVHLAAQSSLAALEREPGQGLRDNILATANALEAGAAVGTRKVVFASSAEVYGHAEDLPIREEAPLKPISAYGWSKAAGEQLVLRSAAQHGHEYAILRLGNVYGPGQELRPDPGVVGAWFMGLLDHRPLPITGGGVPTRDFLFVNDAAEAVVAALVQGQAEIVNIASGNETSLTELARLMCEVSGTKCEHVGHSGPPGEIIRSVLDPTRARHALGWKAFTPLELGLRRTWSYMLAGRRKVATANATD